MKEIPVREIKPTSAALYFLPTFISDTCKEKAQVSIAPCRAQGDYKIGYIDPQEVNLNHT